MFAVYWLKNYLDIKDKYLIYAPNSGDDGYNITAGNLLKGVNIAGGFTLTVPPTNPIWSHPITPGGEDVTNPAQVMNQGDIITVEYIEGITPKEMWRGRVVSQTWDIYKNMTITCEGTLAYLNDVLLPEYNFYWTGVVSHAYDPLEGISSAIFDKLKDLIPGFDAGGVTDIVSDTIENVLPSETFTPDIESITETIEKSAAPTLEEKEDNVDRRVSVYDYLVWVLTIYNSQLSNGNNDQRKRIKIGYIDEAFKGDDYKVNRKTTQYTIAWDEIKEVLLDVFGGVMYTSNWYQNAEGEMVYDDKNSYLYYYKDSIGENSQVVQYGENLINYEYSLDNTERVTRWYIFGKTKDANDNEVFVDMSSVNNGLKYIGINDGLHLGTIARVEYTDLTTPKELFDYGWEKLKKSFFGTYTVSIDAVDLHMLNPDIEMFEPGKTVKMIISNELYTDVIDDLMLETMDLDLLNPENTRYTFKKTGLTP